MAITISGENNIDRILASDGVLDSISGINAAGIVTATSFTGDLTGDVTGNLTGNVNATSNLLLQIGGSEKFRVASSGQLGIGGANYGTSGQVLTSGGSGSAATWSAIPSQVTINNASGNRVITSDGGTTLNGEANLTYNGSNLALTGNDNQYITIGASADLTLKADGSNSAIVHNGDGDLIVKTDGSNENIKLQSAGYTHFLTGGGNERLRIFSNGSVGVGDYSSTNLTHAFQALRTSGSTYVSSKNTGGNAVFYAEASNGNTAKLELMQSGVGNFTLEVGSANTLSIKDDGSERVRINSSGQVGVNRDTDPLNGVKLMVQNGSGNVFYTYHEGTGNNYSILCRNDRAVGSTQATQIIFIGSGNTFVGDIRSTGSSTSYNTSSDYRLKENVTTISDGITRLKTLKPSRFNFKVDKDTTVDGFLAHEVTAVPEAISGTKDEVVTQAMIDNGDAPSDSKLNDPIYQQIDQAKLVPLLTAALQEAVAKIETLESKVATLEGS